MPVNTLFSLLLGSLFAGFHTVAEMYRLYWFYPGLEYVMHFVGGILIVLVLHTLVAVRVLPRQFMNRWAGPILLILGLFILWELFGIYRFGGLKPDFFTDTGLDITFGILGCLVGWFISRRWNK